MSVAKVARRIAASVVIALVLTFPWIASLIAVSALGLSGLPMFLTFMAGYIATMIWAVEAIANEKIPDRIIEIIRRIHGEDD